MAHDPLSRLPQGYTCRSVQPDRWPTQVHIEGLLNCRVSWRESRESDRDIGGKQAVENSGGCLGWGWEGLASAPRRLPGSSQKPSNPNLDSHRAIMQRSWHSPPCYQLAHFHSQRFLCSSLQSDAHAETVASRTACQRQKLLKFQEKWAVGVQTGPTHSN